MKKIILSIVAIAGFSLANAQINLQSDSQVAISNQNPFLDASRYVEFGNSVGKGLYFPRTDLTKWEFVTNQLGGYNLFKTAFDGMVVYNTGTGEIGENVSSGYNADKQGVKVKVEPGFYYFSNPTADPTANFNAGATSVAQGKWIKIADVNPDTKGNFWALNGNGDTTPVNVSDLVDPANGDYSFDPAGKNFMGTTDNKSVTFATGEDNGSGGFKTVARLAIGDIKNRTVEQTNFNFVMEVYGKAHFEDGIVTRASTYPDYVFDNYFTGKSDVNPNYEFKKLNEVEKFIKENNHLPGVTSIKELTKSENGYEVDNTQLSVQTLEKVEELYLHVIEQQKEIQALKAEIAELKK